VRQFKLTTADKGAGDGCAWKLSTSRASYRRKFVNFENGTFWTAAELAAQQLSHSRDELTGIYESSNPTIRLSPSGWPIVPRDSHAEAQNIGPLKTSIHSKRALLTTTYSASGCNVGGSGGTSARVLPDDQQPPHYC
jgi:hypothetical protein